MAIANSYFNSSPITDSDIFVGTKYATNRTVNYTAQSIADYLNINSRISISGQLTFKFTILPNVAKTIAFENGGGDGRLFSSIDKLIVSILDAGGSNITVFLDYLIDSEILLAEQNQPNSFGHYKITSYVVTANPNFYELNLEYIGGNGNIYKDVYYDMTPWASSGGIGTTPNLQQVTDAGATTDNTIYVSDGTNETSIQISQVQILDGLGSYSQIGAQGAGFVNGDGTGIDQCSVSLAAAWSTQQTGLFLSTQDGTGNAALEIKLPPEYYTDLPIENIVSNYFIPFKPSGDYTLATLDDIPSYTTPTLQQVLDNNHDLVDGNNFQGTGAGYGNIGTFVNALGVQTAVYNEGSNVNALGESAAINNLGSEINAFGISAAANNEGNYINAFGDFSALNNTFNNVNLFGQSATADEDGQTVLSKDGTIMARVSTTELTVSRKYTLPDASGTIALTSDITTPTLQQVTDQGSTTTNSISVQNFISTANINPGNIVVTDAISSSAVYAGFLTLTNPILNNVTNLYINSLEFIENGIGKYLRIGDTSLGEAIYNLPNKDYNTGIPYVLATLDDIPSGGGTVTSVDLSMPSAFTVTNNPVTTSGTLTVTGAGAVSQYVRGDGSLANFPTSSGGGSSLSFYLNGSVSQGTFGGVAFKEMDRTPILGAGTDFTINANGYIQSFITDAGVPNQLEIPAGNWNFETYFSASSGGGSPSFYVELYKWDGTTLSLIASNSASPRLITDGTNIEAYFSALAVPQTTLLVTDRLAVRIYVTHSGRTITLHTEDNHLCQVITTFSTGLTALNGLTAQVQNLAVGTTGTDFAINSTTSTHTFNLPTASAANRGALSSADWTTFNNKQNNLKTFNRTQGVYYFEEFMGSQAGSVSTSYSNVISLTTGNGTARTAATTNRTNQQGIIQHSTGTASTNSAGYGLGNSSLYIGTGTISLETYMSVETLSTSLERFFTFFGYGTPSNWQNSGNTIFFSYDEGGVVFFAGTPSPNWKCYTRGGATVTLTTTSIPVVAAQWYKLRIDINAAGNSVTFYIDGTLVATHTTNIPATTSAMSVVSLINKTAGTTARSLLTDYFMYEEIFTNPR
jgi:hypothetical protein